MQSLCYVPLLCSIVISVYRESDEELPASLTESFENFILQTVKRHLEIKRIYNLEPVQLYSLDDLPSVLDVTFIEICQFAYHQLKYLLTCSSTSFVLLANIILSYNLVSANFKHLALSHHNKWSIRLLY